MELTALQANKDQWDQPVVKEFKGQSGLRANREFKGFRASKVSRDQPEPMDRLDLRDRWDHRAVLEKTVTSQQSTSVQLL